MKFIRNFKLITKKIVLNKRIILNAVLITIVSLIVSCSNNVNDTPPINNGFISIPDVSFETILIERGVDSDGILNQQILKEDAKKVINLDLSTLSHGAITNLKGIEGFVNLKKLTVTQHDIEELYLSENTLLDTLYLGGNKLVSIDVSSNTNLILLDAQGNNLTSITGLSNLTKLKNLDLSWNYIEELNIQSESLEILHARDNELKTLNLNEAVSLKNLLLTTNKLTSIDISTNPLLETVLLSNNKIEGIDLSNNIKLSHLHVLDNLFSSLDVSNNQSLVELKVARNPDLTCVKIQNGQNIRIVSKSNYQELNVTCN